MDATYDERIDTTGEWRTQSAFVYRECFDVLLDGVCGPDLCRLMALSCACGGVLIDRSGHAGIFVVCGSGPGESSCTIVHAHPQARSDASMKLLPLGTLSVRERRGLEGARAKESFT